MAGVTDKEPELNPALKRFRPPEKRPEPLYTEAEWRSVVVRLKRERGPWCQVCGSGGQVTAEAPQVLPDGRLDLELGAVELLCTPCRGRKQAQARGRRGRRGD